MNSSDTRTKNLAELALDLASIIATLGIDEDGAEAEERLHAMLDDAIREDSMTALNPETGDMYPVEVFRLDDDSRFFLFPASGESYDGWLEWGIANFGVSVDDLKMSNVYEIYSDAEAAEEALVLHHLRDVEWRIRVESGVQVLLAEIYLDDYDRRARSARFSVPERLDEFLAHLPEEIVAELLETAPDPVPLARRIVCSDRAWVRELAIRSLGHRAEPSKLNTPHNSTLRG